MGNEGEHLASGDPLALLDAAIDALNARLDETVTDGELNQVVIGLAERRHRVEATLAAWAARWDARVVWASDGSRSPAARLARDANEAPATAARTLRRGRAITEMPSTADAWAAGEISGDHVDLLATAHGSGRDQLFTRDEELLVEQCVTLRHRQAQQLLRYWCQRADAELGRDGPEPVATELQVRTTFDGAVVGNFTLDALGGGIVQESLRRIERDLYRQDKQAGITRTKAERMAAALVEQAVRAHTAPEGGQRPRSVADGPRRRSAGRAALRARHRHRHPPQPTRADPRSPDGGDVHLPRRQPGVSDLPGAELPRAAPTGHPSPGSSLSAPVGM